MIQCLLDGREQIKKKRDMIQSIQKFENKYDEN